MPDKLLTPDDGSGSSVRALKKIAFIFDERSLITIEADEFDWLAFGDRIIGIPQRAATPGPRETEEA